ncbi:hypothetical protein JX266_000279 [Neoarthrinium moseri]|uniref:uncharacterized protein n=1 Tax=Neoarthrinium moseri TaxID=1658444 RepID=UPI001FDE47F4|nr:uncharacterized protein JN550_003330 [Neoarthrinium moseri]KAI1855414.1 hypothetical protein JX266_000279 [Neoarthrinium moseri]KAI1873077.1 hypothetical protein JN550_003330 [Neoarthrinium moseri]
MLSQSWSKRTSFLLITAICITTALIRQLDVRRNSIAFTLPLPPQDDRNTYLPATDFPDKIWQSWKDDSENPTDRTVGFPRQWRVVNPTHRYERITDNNSDSYVDQRFPVDISEIFSNLTDPILRADFLRYLVMLREGGVWADIDVLPHQPISRWVPDTLKRSVNLVIGIENDHEKKPIWDGVPYSVQLSQYTMLSKPGHPVFVTLVDEVSRNLRKLLDLKGTRDSITFEEVMSTTGPFAFTKVVMEYMTQATGIEHTGDELSQLREPRLIGDVLILPKDSFGWLPHDHTHERGDPSILVEHLFIGSWREGHPG